MAHVTTYRELYEDLKDVYAGISELYKHHVEIAGQYFGSVLLERLEYRIKKAKKERIK